MNFNSSPISQSLFAKGTVFPVSFVRLVKVMPPADGRTQFSVTPFSIVSNITVFPIREALTRRTEITVFEGPGPLANVDAEESGI
jgi:hypothetical protein